MAECLVVESGICADIEKRRSVLFFEPNPFKWLVCRYLDEKSESFIKYYEYIFILEVIECQDSTGQDPWDSDR